MWLKSNDLSEGGEGEGSNVLVQLCEILIYIFGGERKWSLAKPEFVRAGEGGGGGSFRFS